MANINKRQIIAIIVVATIAAFLTGSGDTALSQGQQQEQPAIGTVEKLQRITRLLGGTFEPLGGLAGRGTAFVRLGDIKGEVTDQAHYEWVKTIWVDYEIKRPEPGDSSVRSNKATFSAVRILKDVDKATPALAVACASGKQIPEVEFHFTQEAGQRRVVYFRMILRKVMINGVGPTLMQESGGKFIHLEEVSLIYDEIEWEYTPFDREGKASAPIRGGWSVSKNRAL
jgi:type VI secretion system secreted protein Hcp